MKLRCMQVFAVFAVLALAMAVGARPAQASAVPTNVVTWNLNGIFCDGGGFSGYVVVDYWGQDPAYKTLANWDITVTPPTGSSLQGVELTPQNPDASATITGDPLFHVFGYDPFELSWSTGSLAADTVGSVAILGGFYSDESGNCDCIQSGSMSPVPEPASWSLLGAGVLLLLGAGLRQRRRSA